MKSVVSKDKITHVAHIDIDEFIVLKKHNNIKSFISDYIKGNCAGIGMNWRFFGSSDLTKKENIPVTIRFTQCEEKGNMHIKTIFEVKKVKHFNTCHDVTPQNNFKIKATNLKNITGPFNKSIDFSVVQLNHYKCKTFEEFQYIRTRGRAGVSAQKQSKEDIFESFNHYNINEVKDLHAHNIYKTIIYYDIQSIVLDILEKII
jgi:hypothetical protein